MTKTDIHECLHYQENVSHAIVTCNSDENIITWNKKAEKIFGYSKKIANGKKLFDLILPDSTNESPKISLQKMDKRDDTSSGVPIIETAYHCSGRPIPVEILVSTIASGLYIVVIFDLTSKIATEEAIQNAHHTQDVLNNILKIALEPFDLKTQLEHVLSYIFTVRTLSLIPKGSIMLADRKTEALTLVVEHGFSPEQKVACKDVALGVCHCGRAASTRKIQFLSSFTDHHDIPFGGIVEPHGHYCVPIIKDTRLLGVICLYISENHIQSQKEEDILIAVSNIVAGIIDNRKVNEQLVESVNSLQSTVMELEDEKKFSDSVIRGLSNGLIVADLDFVILRSNSMAQQLLKPFCHSLNRKTIDSVFGHETAERIISSAGYRPSTTTLLQQDITLKTEDGEEKIFSFSIVPREDMASTQVGYIISFSDMTELTYVRKEMEKMNRLSTVAEIASAVAHEVLNPLAGIKIMAQSIQEHPENTEELLECSRRIANQVDRLNILLSDFFTYARPITPKRTATSVELILSETKPLIANKLMKKNIRLIEKFPSKATSIMADPNQMQQVLLNLFLNSIDAIGEDGEVTITIGKPNPHLVKELKRRHPTILKGSKYIQVLFSDNGCGIDLEPADKIFEPFFTTKSHGTGLGLSIVYRILTENKAIIFVESQKNQGTKFTMLFEMI